MKNKYPIDRESLADCYKDIIEHDIRPVNPVLVYNYDTGRFDIQSNLNPMNENEHIISGQLDTSDGLGDFLGDLTSEECNEFVAGMSDDYIIEYVLGDMFIDQKERD